MIKHVVMFKLKSSFNEDERKQNTADLKRVLEELPNKIKEIKTFEVGINVLPSERAFDLVLISTFENLDALEIYRVHPEHQKAIKFIAPIKEMTTAVDFEFKNEE